MKKLLLLTAAFSFNVMAGTTLVCNDQNSHAVYKLQLTEENSTLVFSPLLKDNSTLAKSVASLKYNEGGSSELYSVYTGKNLDQNTVVVELKNKELVRGKIAEVFVSYSKNASNKLDQKTVFLCDVE
ncbi:hypothetical protein SHI21_03855 [Bacteriovorax sp. PP10]|uniref:Uncharacterized protein n=1 Tax=Bacteriovorax antarcticus TaxID=3088717 RepID=A0ABU5VQX8_9BACT|nr:hypothetical protein [Bacteriovorax sp. PP10]MEA9355317.1 hypothetical protein [Bacteriovorax sp. PP10]